MTYDVAIETSVTNGSSATFAPVDCTASLPSNTPTIVNFFISFIPTAAADYLFLRPGASSSASTVAANGAAAGVEVVTMLTCPTDSPKTDAVDYLVVGSSVNIAVSAYLDQLGLGIVA